MRREELIAAFVAEHGVTRGGVEPLCTYLTQDQEYELAHGRVVERCRAPAKWKLEQSEDEDDPEDLVVQYFCARHAAGACARDRMDNGDDACRRSVLEPV